MSKQQDALRLALEALEGSADKTLSIRAITALREALAAPDFWDGYAPEPVKQQALDKMAENARELGLDYEPVWGSGSTNKDYEDAMRQKRLHQLTSPTAQRTWVGLTDEEKRQIFEREDYQGWLDYINAIEAKLRSKNEDRN